MMTKHLMPFVLGVALLASPAFAAKATHHCVDKDNKEIALPGTAKTPAAQCKAAGGKWVRMKAATAKPATAAPATPAPPAPPTTPKQ
jgi:hypothetical protein